MTWLTALFSPLVGLFQSHQDSKHKAKERKDRLDEAKTVATIKRLEQGDANATRLDELSLANRGWEADYLLFITTLPVLLAFIPQCVPFVEAGFEALESTPEYYWYVLAMIYIDTFGFRRMLRVGFEHWLDKRFGRQ